MSRLLVRLAGLVHQRSEHGVGIRVIAGHRHGLPELGAALGQVQGGLPVLGGVRLDEVGVLEQGDDGVEQGVLIGHGGRA